MITIKDYEQELRAEKYFDKGLGTEKAKIKHQQNIKDFEKQLDSHTPEKLTIIKKRVINHIENSIEGLEELPGDRLFKIIAQKICEINDDLDSFINSACAHDTVLNGDMPPEKE